MLILITMNNGIYITQGESMERKEEIKSEEGLWKDLNR